MIDSASPGHRLIGHRYPRPDARAKASGALTYMTDLRIDGMVDAVVIRSPYPRARVRSVDGSAALAVPGVLRVVAAADVEGVGKGKAFPQSPQVQTVLTDLPMFVGDAVAAVVARDRATALAAAALVDVDYEELPPLLTPEEAAVSDVQLYEEAPGNLAGPPLSLDRGDAEAGLARAARVFDDVYLTQRQCAQTIEPMTCVCRWDEQDRLEVHTHLDNVFHLRIQISEILGLEEDRIRVVAPEAIGATFGLKNGLLASLEPLCALLSREVGAPVRLQLSPEENISATVTRHAARIRLVTGVDAQGMLLARTADVLLDSGACGFGYVVVGSMMSKWAMLYRTPNLRFRGRAVYTNHVPGGAYRGVGTAQIHFAMESQIDAIAHELGADPVEYRLRHVARVGEQLPNGTTIRAFGVDECVRRAAEAIGHPRPRPRRGAGRFVRGIGMALGMHHSGLTNIIPGIVEQSTCRVRVSRSGDVVLHLALIEKGQGALSTLSAVAAETLGVPLERIAVEPIDSAGAPWDEMGAEASRSTYVMGRAVAGACERLREAMAARPGEALEVEYHYRPDDADPLPVVGADFCEVEVDRLTGKIRVLRFVAAQDVGRAINVLGCEGQIEGGVHHGVGYALLEGLVTEEGQPINGDFAGYRVLMAPDMPEITPILVEHPDDDGGPFGAKGLGTGVIPAVAPAVANAIFDATGVRPKELPITPARMLELIERAHNQEP